MLHSSAVSFTIGDIIVEKKMSKNEPHRTTEILWSWHLELSSCFWIHIWHVFNLESKYTFNHKRILHYRKYLTCSKNADFVEKYCRFWKSKTMCRHQFFLNFSAVKHTMKKICFHLLLWNLIDSRIILKIFPKKTDFFLNFQEKTQKFSKGLTLNPSVYVQFWGKKNLLNNLVKKWDVINAAILSTIRLV